MDRRHFIAGTGTLLVSPGLSWAQGPRRRLGFLAVGDESGQAPYQGDLALLNALRERGWIDGKNLTIDLRYSQPPDRLDARKHQYTTLEHLLLALTDDANASRVMWACGVDLAVLQKSLTDYVENELRAIVVETGALPGGCRPTAAFQRVQQRAVSHAEQTGQQEVTGDDMMTAQDAANVVERDIIKRNGAAAS
jgi:hypothetical protein